MNSFDKCMGVLTVSIGLAAGVGAAETTDYSDYVRLANNCTVKSGCPEASCWNPAGEMSDDNSYLVPAGLTLTIKYSGTSGGTWPGQHFVIGGTVSISVFGSRTRSATFPPVTLLEGAQVRLTGPYPAIYTKNSESIVILGTDQKPVVFTCPYQADSNAGKYPSINAPLTGGSDAVAVFSRTVTDTYDRLRAFRPTAGFDNYLGTIIVTNEYAYMRDSSSSSFDIAGTIRIESGATLLIEKLTPTFGNLKLGENATLEIGADKYVTVTNSFWLSDTAKVVLTGVSSTAYVVDDGTATPPSVKFLSLTDPTAAAAVDRVALLAAVVRGGSTFLNTQPGGVPRLKLAEETRSDGGVDFFVTHDPIVHQVKGCDRTNTPYGQSGYDHYFSDNQPISADKDYYTPHGIVLKRAPYVFPGRSMTTANRITLYSSEVLEFPDLRVLTGTWLRQQKDNGSLTLRGNAALYGNLNCRASGNGIQYVAANLSGSGDLIETLDYNANNDCWHGTVELCGTNNTAWRGRAWVGCGRAASDSEGLTNLTLRVSEGQQLGGDLDSFTFDSLKVAETCALAVTNTATFSAANRGWCFVGGAEGPAEISVFADKTATVNETVTWGGAVAKTGEGRLVLGGPARFYDAENDASVTTPNGATLTVDAGSLQVAATNALAGLPVTFKTGASLSVDLSTTGEAAIWGAVLSGSDQLTVEGGGAIPVSVWASSALPNEPVTVAICTVPAGAAETMNFSVPPRGARRALTLGRRTNADGTVTFFLTAKKNGLSVIFK